MLAAAQHAPMQVDGNELRALCNGSSSGTLAPRERGRRPEEKTRLAKRAGRQGKYFASSLADTAAAVASDDAQSGNSTRAWSAWNARARPSTQAA